MVPSVRRCSGCRRRRGTGRRVVDRPDDERVDGWVRVAEPARRDRAGRDQDALADAAAEDVERDEAAAAVDLDLEEGAVRKLVDAPRRPDRADHAAFQHRFSLWMVTPSVRATSRASGVSTA